MKPVSILTVCLLACAVMSGSAAVQAASPDYYPMTVGNTWTLDTTINGQVIPIVMTVTERTPAQADGFAASIESRIEGRAIQIEVYRVNKTGVSRVSSGADGAGVLAPPFPVLKYPIAFDDSWMWKGTITTAGQAMPASARCSVSRPERVAVPAGTSQAIKVHVDLSVEGPDNSKAEVTNDYWFAADVGMVKQVAHIGTNDVAGVMSSYHLQKDQAILSPRAPW